MSRGRNGGRGRGRGGRGRSQSGRGSGGRNNNNNNRRGRTITAKKTLQEAIYKLGNATSGAEYELTTEDYTLDDFGEDLKKKGYIREEIRPDGKGGVAITEKTERALRKRALEQIFGKAHHRPLPHGPRSHCNLTNNISKILAKTLRNFCDMRQ